ncbi:class I SAM-dependent methyltransferase [Luteolibacter flavescens]|uniref:Class I SAM-dependent methyltransferase n=1 Tax=Luteolibacter flavescens TaxID=1859460 RepID=A0ABT3FNQ7_9BACT|nr:class I SAM-dependent methyltransferase [Luteolibacter flavescens]MCW1885200.1 class I SAM-dependent methyltransferase [Luteolibacter flavescens]
MPAMDATMNDPVRELYSERRYPDLSHPVTDISRLWVSARVAGLGRLAEPSHCRVLEFGCAAGQNLLPMAERYPQSDFTGLDFSDTAIRKARQASYEAQLQNVRFEAADLEHWRPSHPCDYLIVHGIFSWVPDSVKTRVLDLCGQVLSDNGVVCISYNTLPGWSLRRDLVPLVKALAGNPVAAGLGDTVESVAASLAEMAGGTTAHTANVQAICRDMMRKGPTVLPFDDFAPVCDAVYFTEFAKWAAERGLRYLGEARLQDNLPDGISPEAYHKLAPLAADPVLLQQTLDLLSGRTHRNSLFCRVDAAMEEGVTTAVVMHFAAGPGPVELPPVDNPVVSLFRQLVADASPSCVPVQALMERTAERLGGGWEPAVHSRELAKWIYQAARLGGIELRAEPLSIRGQTMPTPRLSPLNLHFAGQGRPVVDARHFPCRYPDGHQGLMAKMDGTLSYEDLAEQAHADFPELDFHRWVAHLAERGIVL